MNAPGACHPEADNIIPLYQRIAATFDRKRGKSLMEKGWLDRFLALVEGDRQVLDLGCGSGEPIARYLIESGCLVTGVDSAAAMLDLCRARFPDHIWIEGDMRRLDLGQTFDGVLAWNSFFHLDREAQRAMFPIFAAHTAPGAPLIFTCGPGDGEAIGEMEGAPLFHASLAQDEYEDLMRRNGFDPLLFIPEDPDCNQHCVWLARREGA